ncbi:MAG: GIY-YIG nuclease family protein, partial [Pseudomonadota bacterium]
MSSSFGPEKPDTWFVYMVECRDGALYTGITNDLDRR